MKFSLGSLLILLTASLSESADLDFNPVQMLPPFDPIVDPIVDPEIAGPEEAGEWVEDDELVLGVVVGDEARAYPINMLTQPTREIINDRLGGRSIAATW